jgi:hypothetical protein
MFPSLEAFTGTVSNPGETETLWRDDVEVMAVDARHRGKFFRFHVRDRHVECASRDPSILDQ